MSNSVSSPSLHDLREKIGAIQGHLKRGTLSHSAFAAGIPQGALVELVGHQKLEWLCLFFKENPELKVFWAEPQFTLLPTALQQRGVNLDHFLFAETGDQLFKPVRLALRAQVFECIVVPSLFEEEKTLKALQLLSEKANSTVFLLGQEPQSSWPISVQLKISRGPSVENPFSVEVLKYKTRGAV